MAGVNLLQIDLVQLLLLILLKLQGSLSLLNQLRLFALDHLKFVLLLRLQSLQGHCVLLSNLFQVLGKTVVNFLHFSLLSINLELYDLVLSQGGQVLLVAEAAQGVGKGTLGKGLVELRR